MKTYQVGEFKALFSEIIEKVRAGEEIIISYGKKKENVAVLIPYAAYKTKRIRLGLLQDKMLKIHDDFKMNEEELLSL
ncbi:MAG: type II toxin-antitoxin system prevent-host-death family antitoxin [Caldilineaceae bacterium]